MIALSTHVLDAARGAPAAGIAVTVDAVDGERRTRIGEAVTNGDGRIDAPLQLPGAGTYELLFDVAAYFAARGDATLFARIPVRIVVAGGARYHVPLLLSPWSYTTYRGS